MHSPCSTFEGPPPQQSSNETAPYSYCDVCLLGVGIRIERYGVWIRVSVSVTVTVRVRGRGRAKVCRTMLLRCALSIRFRVGLGLGLRSKGYGIGLGLGLGLRFGCDLQIPHGDHHFWRLANGGRR